MAVKLPKQSSMSDVDFVEGILTVAALRGYRRFEVADTRFDQAMAAAYHELVTTLRSPGLRIEFRIQPHSIHRDSPVLRGAVNAVVGDRRVRRLNPTFKMVETTTLEVQPNGATPFLKRLPGDEQMYERLADSFLAAYYDDDASLTAKA